MGGRDHTTVLHAVRRVGTALKSDPELISTIEKLKAKLDCEDTE